MAKDDFANAVLQLQQAQKDFGPHVLLLADLAHCFFRLKDTKLSHDTTQAALTEYQNVKTQLSVETRLSLTISLGRLLEEEGSVAEALNLYLENSLEETSLLRDQVLIQRLRLLSQLKVQETTASLYESCLRIRSENQSRNFELDWALVVADFFLLNAETAFLRLTEIFKNVHLADLEKRQLKFSFLYEALLNQKNQLILPHFFSDLNYHQASPFEKALWDLNTQTWGAIPLRAANSERAKSMNPIESIRYFSLLLSTDHVKTHHELAKKSLSKLVQGLSKESQLIFQNSLVPKATTTPRKRTKRIT